jgi:hypothetical protein
LVFAVLLLSRLPLSFGPIQLLFSYHPGCLLGPCCSPD